MGLTKKDIERATKRRRYSDGRGLFLSVSASGRKTWSFLYRFPDSSKDVVVNGKRKKGYREREMNLGPVSLPHLAGTIDEEAALTLDEARDRTIQLRKDVRQGIDPMEKRDRETRHVTRQRRDGSTFKEVAERYVDMKKAEWDEGGASEQSWRGSLAKHVYPVIGDMAIDRIDRADVLDLLKPIWVKVPVTATRLLPRLDLIFGHAIEEGLRPSNNPADRDSIRKSLPKASRVHTPKRHKALIYADVPGFMAELHERQAASPYAIGPKALEFTILTALRTKEVIGAKWDEIDLEAGIWTIPASRMKIKRTGSGDAREAHRVPLSKRVLAILHGLPREESNPFVFISVDKKGQGLSNGTMLKELKEELGYAGKATVHGFRASFKTWSAVATNHPHEVSELALAHYPSDKTVSAYLRTDLLEKRVPLMDDWAAFTRGKIDAA